VGVALGHEPLDEDHLKTIQKIVQEYLKIPIKVSFAKYCYACDDCRKQPVMWTGERITHVDTGAFDKLPYDYLAFMIGHEFGHARYTFPMDCVKANDYSVGTLRRAGMQEDEIKRLLQRWVDDSLALENGKSPSWV
jgi:hypothetical protein